MNPHTRRNVLQAIGASGIGIAGATGIGTEHGTVTATCEPEPDGRHYDVQVFVTEALYEHCEEQYGDGFRAQDRAETWIEGASDRVNQDVTVRSNDEIVPAPAEIIRSSETVCVADPCGSSTKCYGSVLRWWRDYASCQLDVALAADSNVLLTAGRSTSGNRLVGGGRAFRGGNTAVAYTGLAVPDVDETYSETVSAPNAGANGTHTVLHELGHNFQMTMREAESAHNNEDYDVHDVGGSTSPDGAATDTVVSPLADPGSINECGCDVDSQDGYLMTWTGCSISYWGDSA